MAITTTTIVAANDNIYLYRTGIRTTTVYNDDEGRGKKERDDEQAVLYTPPHCPARVHKRTIYGTDLGWG